MMLTISILAGLAVFTLIYATIVTMSKQSEPPVEHYSSRESPSTTTTSKWTTPTQKNEEWLKRSLEKAKSNKPTRSGVRRDKDLDLDSNSSSGEGSYIFSHDDHSSHSHSSHSYSSSYDSGSSYSDSGSSSSDSGGDGGGGCD